MMGRSIQPAIYSHARLATICAISADSGLIRKLPKLFCLGSQLPGDPRDGVLSTLLVLSDPEISQELTIGKDCQTFHPPSPGLETHTEILSYLLFLGDGTERPQVVP